ncbi:hypothetical protein VTL71DRAFT_2047 [Oculimacula yallundae]|uniref:Uncharacterized protein n=1 Tax=Oculimacula yallundae TaxID=86028 RepID=A0ABR4C911_9HELO
MLPKCFVSLLLLFARVAVAFPVIPAADVCLPIGGRISGGDIATSIINVVTIEVIIIPIVIDTIVEHNTILRFLGCVTIRVNNAPTQILTVAYGTTSATRTATTTVLPGNVNIYETTNIVNYPVTISTFIQQNTIIQGGGGVNVIINNAPTFILTTAIGTSTETATATVTSTITTSNSLPTSFLLSPLTAVAPAQKSRRQVSNQQFITSGGDILSSCSQASIFTINNGQLSVGVNVFSTDGGVPSALFSASQAIGNISTAFSISDRLVWSNTAFSGGQARFCSVGGRITALFTANATVPGCAIQNLFAIPAASCRDGIVVSSSSNVFSLPTPTGSISSSRSSFTTTASTSSPSPSSSSLISTGSDSTSSSGSIFSTSGSTTSVSRAQSTVPTSTTGGSSVSSTVVSSLTTIGSSASDQSRTEPSTSITSLSASASTSSADLTIVTSRSTSPSESSTATTMDFQSSTSDIITSTSLTTSTDVLGSTSTLPTSTSSTHSSDSSTSSALASSDLMTSSTSVAGSSSTSTSDFTTSSFDVATSTSLPHTTISSTLSSSTSSTGPVIPTCTALGQIYDPGAALCACESGFSPSIDSLGGLVCAAIPTCTGSGQVYEPGTNTCVCDAGFFTSADPLGNLLCTVIPICTGSGQVYEPGTNACVCDTGFFKSADPLGNLLCITIPSCTGSGQNYNPVANVCECDAGLFASTDFSTGNLICMPIPSGTGSGQVYNSGTNLCECQSGLFTFTDPISGVLVCSAIPSCTSFGQIYNSGTSSCECDPEFYTSTDPTSGALVCAVIPSCTSSGQIYNPRTNMCECTGGYVSSTDPRSGELTCTIVCSGLGLVPDPVTNTCVCDNNYAPTTDPVTGVVISCVTTVSCLGLQTMLDVGSNTCVCNTGFTPDPVGIDGTLNCPNPVVCTVPNSFLSYDYILHHVADFELEIVLHIIQPLSAFGSFSAQTIRLWKLSTPATDHVCAPPVSFKVLNPTHTSMMDEQSNHHEYEIPFEGKKPIICITNSPSPSPTSAAKATSSPLIFTHGAGGTLSSDAVLNFRTGFASHSPITCFQGSMSLPSRVKMFDAVISYQAKTGSVTTLGGRSMGARAAVIAAKERQEVKYLILVSYPLHTDKEVVQEDVRLEILLAIEEGIKVLFVVGDSDKMCDLERLEDARQKMNAVSWRVVVESADHGMNIKPKTRTKGVGELVGKVAAEWLESREEGRVEDQGKESRISWNEEKDVGRWSGWEEKALNVNFKSEKRQRKSENLKAKQLEQGASQEEGAAKTSTGPRRSKRIRTGR